MGDTLLSDSLVAIRVLDMNSNPVLFYSPKLNTLSGFVESALSIQQFVQSQKIALITDTVMFGNAYDDAEVPRISWKLDSTNLSSYKLTCRFVFDEYSKAIETLATVSDNTIRCDFIPRKYLFSTKTAKSQDVSVSIGKATFNHL